MKRLAYMNGHETTAAKVNGRWMVGGDFDTTGNVLVAGKDSQGEWSWFSLKGCFLRFQDRMTDAEVAKQLALEAA